MGRLRTAPWKALFFISSLTLIGREVTRELAPLVQVNPQVTEAEVEIQSTRGPSPPRRAYALLSYGDDREMMCAVATTALACKELPDALDVIVFRIGKVMASDILPEGVRQIPVERPATRGRYGWTDTFAKFYIASLADEYESIVFLDADVFIKRPLTPLFELAETLNDTLVSPRAYWLKQPFGMSGTFALSRGGAISAPIHQHMNGVIQHASTERFDSDMDWFNADQTLASDMTLVSGFFSLLVGEFFPNDKIFGYWGKRLGLTPQQVYDRAYVIHFIANWKPWRDGLVKANGVETEQLRASFREWHALRARVCSAQE